MTLLKYIQFNKTLLLSVLIFLSFAINVKGQQSVLAQGEWVKMTFETSGVYRVDFTTLSEMGIDPISIDPRNLAIYGIEGGMLPQSNAVNQPSDPTEISIRVFGENDGTFGPEDYILFYVDSPHKDYYNEYYNQPRITQDELYDSYLSERQNVYDELSKDFNLINVKKLVEITKFDYNTIPDTFTYDIEVNKNFRYPNKKDRNPLNIVNYNTVNKKEHNIHFNDVNADISDNESLQNGKCDSKKIKECADKGKVCNPDTGRCVAKLKPKKNQEKFQEPKEQEPGKVPDEQEPKEQEPKEPGKVPDEQEPKEPKELKEQEPKEPAEPGKDPDEQEPKELKEQEPKETKEKLESKCNDKKIKECADKGKVCNPDTGRCVAKLKPKK